MHLVLAHICKVGRGITNRGSVLQGADCLDLPGALLHHQKEIKG